MDSTRIVVLDAVFGMKKVEVEGLYFYVGYTFLCYVIPFFVGLHMTYLDFIPFLQKIVITKHVKFQV